MLEYSCQHVLHVCYIIGFIIGVGLGHGLDMVPLVIAADATVAKAVNMATTTTTFIVFIKTSGRYKLLSM